MGYEMLGYLKTIKKYKLIIEKLSKEPGFWEKLTDEEKEFWKNN